MASSGEIGFRRFYSFARFLSRRFG